MISVIVPVYNTPSALLQRCIDSILCQSHGDFELLLIDDGSTAADTAATLCAVHDPRVRCIRQENGGVSAARNRGLSEATGEFVALVDADDCVTPQFFERAVAAFGEKSTDAVMLKTIWCDTADNTLKTNLQKGAGAVTVYALEDKKARDAVLRECVCWKPKRRFVRAVSPEIWGKVYRRAAVGTLRFDTSLTIAEDQLFFAAFLCKARAVKVVDTVGYRYTVREGSAMSGRTAAAAEQYRRFFARFYDLIGDKKATVLYEKAYYTLREMLEIFDPSAPNDAASTAIDGFLRDERIAPYLRHIPLCATHVPLYDRLLSRFGTFRVLQQMR